MIFSDPWSVVDRQELGWLTCTIGAITFLRDFKFDQNNDLFLPRFIYGSCLSPTRTRSTSDILCFLYEKCKILCHSVFNALVVSTFPTGKKPHQIKSNSLINALFAKKILKLVKYQIQHEDVILGFDLSMQMIYCATAGWLFCSISVTWYLCLHYTLCWVNTGTEFTVSTQLSWLELTLGMAAPVKWSQLPYPDIAVKPVKHCLA